MSLSLGLGIGTFAAGLFGGERANDANAAEGAKNREFQDAQSAKQMAFQERMSNTAHQRQMQDLKKAGLNPILSVKSNGASSPGGASGSGAQAQIKDTISPALSSAMQMARFEQELDNLKATENKTLAETASINQAIDIKSPAGHVFGEAGKAIERGINSAKDGIRAISDLERWEKHYRPSEHPSGKPERKRSILQNYGKKNQITINRPKHWK